MSDTNGLQWTTSRDIERNMITALRRIEVSNVVLAAMYHTNVPRNWQPGADTFKMLHEEVATLAKCVRQYVEHRLGDIYR